MSTLKMDTSEEELYKKLCESDAPQWFKDTFSLLWEDMSDIRQNITRLNQCEETCSQNKTDINLVKQQMSEVQEKNKSLDYKVAQLDLTNRKQNHNVP